MLHVEKINEKVTFVGAKDPDLRIFDVFMKTPFGTTYNSYIINGGEEYALIDSAKEYFIEEYIEMLKKEVGDLKKIKYLISNHMEPDHSGEIGRLLQEMPHLTIVATPSAQGFLKEIANNDSFNFLEVKEGTTLQVGSETLSFEIVPNMHWPETMVTYLHSTKQLFTCDIFGAHYCSDHVYADQVEEEHRQQYLGAQKYYYTCIFKPFFEYVLSATKKLSKFEIKELCPAHGCALRVTKKKNWIKEVIENYNTWSNDHAVIEEDKIAICYTSAYGYTARIAQEIAKAIEAQHLRPVLVDLVTQKPQDAIREILTSQAFLVGSPTINADTQPQIWETLHSLSPMDVEGRLAGSFGSFGWSGEAVRNIESRLSQLKCEVYRPSLRIKFNPNTEEKLKKAFVFGEQFAKKVLSLKTLPKTDWAKIKTGKWKCLVCGEVFEGEYPPEECPVCGAPADQFVEILDKSSEYSSEDERRIVIVGGGVAAISAIESIRERNTYAPIVMCSDEKILPYYRILLSKKLCTELECEIKSQQWFKENNVELKLDSKIVQINREHKYVETLHGEHIGYDKLIIATGARANCVPVHGRDKRGVFCLRSREDFNRIDEFVKSKHVKKAVIQGGGILGIEVACSLMKQGIEVTVVEFSNRIMLRQLDTDGSELLQRHLEDNGMNILVSESIEEIYGTGHDLMDVCGVELQNAQKRIDCDLVIQNTGIIANTELAKAAGLTVNRGIIVNASMQTDDENIFACGDCIEFQKYPGGLWAIAIEQGEVAGAQAIGDSSVQYFPKPISTSFNEFGYKTFSIGDYGYKEDAKEYQILELKDPKTEVYRKFYFLNNIFVGGILMGDTKKAVHLRKAIDKGSQIQTFLDAHFLDE
ncbi:MAG: FAD-dependent oxidoreductase [Candidatus Woesearchaeota archaeon]